MSLKKDLNFGINMTNKIESKLERDLKKEFAKTLKEVKSKIARAYEKYDVMTYQEMNKFNRLKNLQKELNAQITRLGSKNINLYNKRLGEVYTETYYATGYAMEKGVQAKLSYTSLDSRVIKATLQNPISGLTLNERLRNDRRGVIIRIKGTVTQGLIKGDSYSSMAKALTESMEMEYNKAIRIARTEAHRCQVIGRRESLDHAEEKGVVGSYIWNATLDGRTRDSHGIMDGQKADKDGYFTLPSGLKTLGPGLSGDPAEDINCRCSLTYQIDGFEPTERRVRGEGVIPYTSYSDWKENRLAG